MERKPDRKQIKEWIAEYVLESPRNTLHVPEGLPAWDVPIIGIAAGEDTIFTDYKEHIGLHHWTPAEAFREHFPEWDGAAEDLSVIAWILPQTERTKNENRRATKFPSESWIRSRIFGEQMNESLRRDFVEWLENFGVRAMAPMLSARWKRFGWETSTWSERHAAYAAGLGTFGLCDGLITPLGKAVRIGSVIAEMFLEPDMRPYKDHHEYCLYYRDGSCTACIERCPAGAISGKGHDKSLCNTYCHGVIEEYSMREFGLPGYGCGLCQTNVPCESTIPGKDKPSGS